MGPTFNELSAVTIGELGMGIMLLRETDSSIEDLCDGFCDFFRTNVMPAEVRMLYTRMVERNWICVDPSNARLIRVTKEGHDLLLASFTALIRLVDEGHGALEISLLFSLASRRLTDAQED